MAEEKKQANLVEDGNLEGVAGGRIMETPALPRRDKKHPWEIVDDKTGYPVTGPNGKILTFATRQQAEDYCTCNGYSKKRVWAFGTVRKARDAYEQYIASGGDPNKYVNPVWDD